VPQLPSGKKHSVLYAATAAEAEAGSSTWSLTNWCHVFGTACPVLRVLWFVFTLLAPLSSYPHRVLASFHFNNRPTISHRTCSWRHLTLISPSELPIQGMCNHT
jgi:hypothetical protein